MTDTLANMIIDSHAIREWKLRMMDLILMKHPSINKKKIEKYLDDKIMKYGRNPKVVVINNYRNYELKTNILELIDYIEKYGIIIGGEGCLFMPHPENEDDVHVIIQFIEYNKAERNKRKKLRDSFQKGTFEWLVGDIRQNNTKLKNNGLYGCEGCVSFFLYNRFIASSITNMGRQIICSATMTFENFLGIDVQYNMESELYTFIQRVITSFHDEFPLGLTIKEFNIGITVECVAKKLESRCAFPITTDFACHLRDILETLNDDELTLLYYKNNLIEFCKTNRMKSKLKFIMSNIQQLRSPNVSDFVTDNVMQAIDEVNQLMSTYVLYTDPMFDRVRKTMFTDRDKVIYTDTDSTFLALNQWVTFIKDDVLEQSYAIEETEMNYIVVNVMTYILGFVIADGLKKLCDGSNIEEVWAKLLKMKNEFYMSMIVFTNAKKRYISDAVLQEGKLLIDKESGDIGFPEIKGFDFKKAVVKPFVTNYFTELSIKEILRADEVRVDKIYEKLIILQHTIEDSIKSGSREFYKQAKVQLIEQYKRPYSLPGVRGVLLWNCLFEDMQMELPVDVDIVPIKIISDKKGRIWFESKYPELYRKVETTFFHSDNELIRDMELKVIALPKSNVDIPTWLFDLIDIDKIVSDIVTLFYPIMESLGLQINKLGKRTYLTNMVDL